MQMIEIPGCDPFPRRNRIDLMTPVEIDIFVAQRSVEQAGASEALTEAGMLLERARGLVADHVEAAT
jgi:hypothetical protein